MPPGWTEFLAVKLPCSVAVAKVRLPGAESRVSNATSDGEFTRVGTLAVEKVGDPLVRPTSESFGNTRYISTTTWPMLGFAPVSNPVKVALVITVELEGAKTKSSADLISNLPPTSGRVAVAILPSGSPVLKNGVAPAGSAVKRPIESAEIANPGMYGRMIPSMRVGKCLCLHGK